MPTKTNSKWYLELIEQYRSGEKQFDETEKFISTQCKELSQFLYIISEIFLEMNSIQSESSLD